VRGLFRNKKARAREIAGYRVADLSAAVSRISQINAAIWRRCKIDRAE
jgi:hypothetical protein